MTQPTLSLPRIADSQVNVRPPSVPWSPLRVEQPATGYLSMYLADDLSRLPVRHITRPRDNKSDPNIETGTYGMFSTCERQMRSGIVNVGAQYVIFMCRWRGRRVVTGYYRLRWKAPGTLHTAKKADFVLAADEIHFVDPPIPVSELPEPLASVAGTGFRLSKRIDSARTLALVAILRERPNAIADYLIEIDRLERFQSFHSGFRYVTWQQQHPFSWEIASRYLEPSTGATVVSNQSPTGFWRCADCEQFVSNQSLLKRCPFCGSMGALHPVTDPIESSKEE